MTSRVETADESQGIWTKVRLRCLARWTRRGVNTDACGYLSPPQVFTYLKSNPGQASAVEDLFIDMDADKSGGLDIYELTDGLQK